MAEQITAGQFHAAEGVEDWRCLYHVISAYFRSGSLVRGAAFVDEIGRLAEEGEEQYLNIDLRHAGVTVTLMLRDVALARRISDAARRLGIPADPSVVQLVNITVDALVGEDVLPFWRALLGYRQIGDDYLSDPHRRGPGFGLQQMDAPRPQRNRIHVDVAVPHDQADARIVAALAAGAGWSPKHTRRSGGSWPTRRATRRASPPGSAVNSESWVRACDVRRESSPMVGVLLIRSAGEVPVQRGLGDASLLGDRP